VWWKLLFKLASFYFLKKGVGKKKFKVFWMGEKKKKKKNKKLADYDYYFSKKKKKNITGPLITLNRPVRIYG